MSVPPPPGSLPPPLDDTSAMSLPPTEKPNPVYRELYQAYAAAYGSIGQLRKALDPALKTLRGTDAWLGPESREWGGQLDARRGDLQKAADRILWDMYDRLSATQRVITRA
ncbi:hypothetical protein [Spirillospora sp. NPDC047279]|uniref:hypothetical protein n=1 Tax=Spirillospora sp. NPDC047279 TaxID=3155478 RepID=UPI0033E4215E